MHAELALMLMSCSPARLDWQAIPEGMQRHGNSSREGAPRCSCPTVYRTLHKGLGGSSRWMVMFTNLGCYRWCCGVSSRGSASNPQAWSVAHHMVCMYANCMRLQDPVRSKASARPVQWSMCARMCCVHGPSCTQSCSCNCTVQHCTAQYASAARCTAQIVWHIYT